MKPFAKTLLLLLSLSILVLSLFACKDNNGTGGDDPEPGPTHSHTFATEWTKDATGHWHAATCEHKDERSQVAPHLTDAFGVCSVCGYHIHVFSGDWSFDADSHWHRATCAHNEETDSLAAHTFGKDDICEVCGYDRSPTIAPIPITVTFVVEGATAPEPQTVSSDLTVTAPASPIIPGYTFLGWFEDGSSDPYLFSTPAGRESFTLTAHFSKDYSYTESAEGITLTAYLGKETVITLPAELYGKKILSFGTVFAGSDLAAITLEHGITEIADGAFAGCESLTAVTLADDTFRIGERAFLNCSALGRIVIPKSVKYIGKECFNGCDSCIALPEVSEKQNGWSSTWFPDKDRVYYNLTDSTLPIHKF